MPLSGGGPLSAAEMAAIAAMATPDMSAYPTKADVAANMAASTPPPVNSTGAVGTSQKFAREDHTHVSSVFKRVFQTDASGNVSWTYPTAFDAAPVVQLTVEDSSSQALLAKITSNTATGGTAKVIKSQTLPASITVVTSLQSFNVFAGTVGAGINVHVFAAKAST